MIKPTFEESFSLIHKYIDKREIDYALISYMDWDDLRQNILLYIWKKWHYYNNEMSLENWVENIVSRQIKAYKLQK